jgi:hypothetical protein
VNSFGIERFRKQLTSIRKRYAKDLEQLAVDEARKRGLQDLAAITGEEVCLEAHTRLYMLDPLLTALGWDVSSSSRMVVEDGVNEDKEQDAHRRRLDYHGRDSNTGASLLVTEAKRASVLLPGVQGRTATSHITRRDKDVTVREFIAQELARISKGQSELGSAAWREILRTSVDYAKRVVAQSGAAPKRFVLTNGHWYLVFSDVQSTLLTTAPDPESIELFSSLDEVYLRAERFTELLSYHDLSGYIPIQHPSALKEFIPLGDEALCAKGVEVHYTRYGEHQPLQSIRVGVWIRVQSGRWIHFAKEYDDNFVILSPKNAGLQDSLSTTRARAAELLNELKAQRTLRFAEFSQFEQSPNSQTPEVTRPAGSMHLVEEVSDEKYRLLTLEEADYFHDDLAFDQCPFHLYGECKAEGSAVGDHAIAAPSSNPRCYFPSGSSHHCSHAAIFTTRKSKCLLLKFEEYLCCRRCAFLDRCWPDRSIMPCKTEGAH